jgi:hypothetical protein
LYFFCGSCNICGKYVNFEDNLYCHVIK